MYSNTTKQILGPIADAIEDLVMLNATADIQNTAMPDLTDVGAAIVAQASQMAKIGQSMLAEADEQLQRELSDACEKGIQSGVSGSMIPFQQ